MSHHFSQEIQGLRAIAVISVVIYHIWPSLLPGGYVGVDVFFVISGYLITRILLREANSTNTISLKKFYARRINRLLPATAAVIFISTCFYWILPSLEWMNVAKQAIASTLYVQNWFLAIQAVDYLGAEEAPGLFQHFWSLSVEEQFYIAWPILILSCLFISKKKGGNPSVLITRTIWCVFIGGLIYSIIVTNSNPTWAYFSTFTRSWELALGGCLASIGGSQSRRIQSLGSTVGIMAIVVVCFAFSDETLFPGYMALLPTIATALVIYSTQRENQFLSTFFLKLKMMQYLGGISYSLYLWHWPIIVFYKYSTSNQIGLIGGILVILASILMAHISKEFIEDRFRKKGGRTALKVLIICAIVPIVNLVVIKIHFDMGDPNLRHLHMAPNDARRDLPEVYKLGCHTSQKSHELTPCTFGDSSKGKSIVIVGDSHAAQWVPALRVLSKENNIKLISYTKSACNISNNSVYNKGARYFSCEQWRNSLLKDLAKINPTLVILTQSRTYKPFDIPPNSPSASLIAEGIASTAQYIEKLGFSYILVADTPRLTVDIPVCLSGAPETYSACNSPKQKIIDPIQSAVQTGNMRMVDMNKHICPRELCDAVRGKHIIWRDKHHITASFSRALADSFWQELITLEPSLSAE